jgi:hypothetical protein
MRVGGKGHAPINSHPGQRPNTHFTRERVGPRVGMDGRGKFRPHRNSIPDRPYLLCAPLDLK